MSDKAKLRLIIYSFVFFMIGTFYGLYETYKKDLVSIERINAYREADLETLKQMLTTFGNAKLSNNEYIVYGFYWRNLQTGETASVYFNEPKVFRRGR